ncbi:hypothetical protein [Stenotrophomonas sp. 59]|uniref:hypothetical protein n=1 Tax=Stenotrophomonas sp. 59 TaxID=3051120 RepID=UPI00256EC686|nr:hypothetical protein [Stenotrophomonas sp. 59]
MKKWLLLGTHLLIAMISSLLGGLYVIQMFPSLRQQYSNELATSIHLLFNEQGQARDEADLRRRISLDIANSLHLSANSPGRSESELERLRALSRRVLQQDLLRYVEQPDARRNALDGATHLTRDLPTHGSSLR